MDLIDDMFETMYEANGVGLAAPQVGILKRIVVIDTTGENPYILINPRIVETSGEQTGQAGQHKRQRQNDQTADAADDDRKLGALFLALARKQISCHNLQCPIFTPC